MVPIKNGTSAIIILLNRYAFLFIYSTLWFRHLYNTTPRHKVVIFRAFKRKSRKIVIHFFNRISVKAHPSKRMICFTIFLVFTASCIQGSTEKTTDLGQEVFSSINTVTISMEFEIHFSRQLLTICGLYTNTSCFFITYRDTDRKITICFTKTSKPSISAQITYINRFSFYFITQIPITKAYQTTIFMNFWCTLITVDQTRYHVHTINALKLQNYIGFLFTPFKTSSKSILQFFSQRITTHRKANLNLWICFLFSIYSFAIFLQCFYVESFFRHVKTPITFDLSSQVTAQKRVFATFYIQLFHCKCIFFHYLQ